MQSSKPFEGFVQRTEFQKHLHLDLFNHSVILLSLSLFVGLYCLQRCPCRCNLCFKEIWHYSIATNNLIFPCIVLVWVYQGSIDRIRRRRLHLQRVSKYNLSLLIKELSSFSIKNVNESSILPNELNKRNFYLQLFRTYCDLPFDELTKNFLQVYNDVFFKEKPLTIQKYYLCEVAIVETTAFS